MTLWRAYALYKHLGRQRMSVIRVGPNRYMLDRDWKLYAYQEARLTLKRWLPKWLFDHIEKQQ